MVEMYDALSSDYDRFVNWPQRLAFEIPLLAGVLPSSPHGGKARVLDTACGTGQHAIALAKLGFQAVGTDFSEKMIEIARQNASRSGLTIPFITAGFGNIKENLGKDFIKPEFDALLCLGNSLPHLTDTTMLHKALEDFSACLRPGGVLIIQNRNFDAVVAARNRWMEPQAHCEGQREWLFVRFYDFLSSGLIDFNILTLTRSGQEPWQQRHDKTTLMPQSMEMLSRTVAAAGFHIQKQLGDLSGSPYDPANSPNTILIAVKQS